MHFPSNNSTKKNKSPSKTVSVVKHSVRSSTSHDRKPTTIVKVMGEKIPKKQNNIRSPPITKTEGGDQTVGIHIDSPNSNVRIQGSKIEVKEKPGTKREIILKVPDPSKFMTSPPPHVDSRKTKKSSVASSVPPPLTPDPKIDKAWEHSRESRAINAPIANQVNEDIPPPPLRRRPERSAKKRAKDSISEITEAERPVPMEREEFLHHHQHHERLRNPVSSPTVDPSHHLNKRWSSPRSPYSATNVAHSHGGRASEFYANRSPPPPIGLRSPPVVEGHRHSPYHHHHHRVGTRSPERTRSRSPTPSSLHPTSPPIVRHRPSHSPHSIHPPSSTRGRIGPHSHSPRYRGEILEERSSAQHYHYNEPLSPRYRGSGHDSPYYYSERSRSPYFYDYPHHRHNSHENERERLYEELERRSPPIKHRRLTSPVGRDRAAVETNRFHQLSHREFVHHPNEPIVSPRHRASTLHSPSQQQQESRFPYERMSSWEKSRLSRHHDAVHSPPVRHSPVDPQFQYQPLSRMPHKEEQSTLNVKDRFSRSRSPPPPSKHKLDRIGVAVPSMNSPKTPHAHNHMLSPTSSESDPSPKRSKVYEIERTVIEIPEKVVHTQEQRKISAPKKKGLGLLEMKIQGLKSKIEQTEVSEKIQERDECVQLKEVKTKPSRSLLDVISSLSSGPPKTPLRGGDKPPVKTMPPLLSPSTLSIEVPDPPRSDDTSLVLREKPSSSEQTLKPKHIPNKRSKSLADIAKNLTKCAEKQIVIEHSITVSKPKVSRSIVSVTGEGSTSSGSKLSDVISSLKKSKVIGEGPPLTSPKETPSVPSSDSKLLSILKSGNASKPTKSFQRSPSSFEDMPASSKLTTTTMKSSVSTGEGREGEPLFNTSAFCKPTSATIKSANTTGGGENDSVCRKASQNKMDDKPPFTDKFSSTHSVKQTTNLLSPPPTFASETAKSPDRTEKSKLKKHTDASHAETIKSANAEGQKLLKTHASRSPLTNASADSLSLSERVISPAGSPVYSPPAASSPLTVIISKQKSHPCNDGNNATTVITPTRTPTPILSPLSQSLPIVHRDSPKTNDSKSSTPSSFPASPPKLVDEAPSFPKLSRPTAIIPAAVRKDSKDENGD